MNSKKFKIKLLEKDKSIEDIASHIGCNIATLYRKLNGASDFSRNEIQQIANCLELTAEEVNLIFFDEKLA